jgi:hypothetical protein
MSICCLKALGDWVPLPYNILKIIDEYNIPYECENCNDNAIEKMGFTRANGIKGVKGMNDMKGPILYNGIKIYCRELLLHSTPFTYNDFKKVYIGHWYKLGKCAKSICGFTRYSCKFAYYQSDIFSCIDWEKLWNKIKHDYYENTGHVFRSLYNVHDNPHRKPMEFWIKRIE